MDFHRITTFIARSGSQLDGGTSIKFTNIILSEFVFIFLHRFIYLATDTACKPISVFGGLSYVLRRGVFSEHAQYIMAVTIQSGVLFTQSTLHTVQYYELIEAKVCSLTDLIWLGLGPALQ